MDLQTISQQFIIEISKTGWMEWMAVIFGIAQVLLAWKNNVLLYPAGIISTAFSIYILAYAVLYAEAFLNLYYLVMSVYGWWLWIRNKNEKELPVTKTNQKEWGITALIVIISFIILYLVLSCYTDSDVPAWDAWVSATAWAGMWLLTKRKVENWLVLNVSNLFAVPLQFHKGIYLYALLTLILFIVAIFGYFRWKKIAEMQKVQAI